MSKPSRGRPPHDDTLTPAEWRVVNAVRHGIPRKSIASLHRVSADAIKFHLANALGKLGLSGREELRHWPGIARHTLLHTRDPIMSEQELTGAIAQISRTVTDIAAATKWYRDTLGLPHLYSFGTLAFFDCGGVRLFLSETKAEAPTESIIYFKVQDVRTAHARLADRGVVFAGAPHMVHRHADGTEEWMAVFHDPDGRPLAIMAQVRP